MITLPIILGVAAAMAGIGLVAVLSWLLYTSYLNRLERRLAYRKGLYRDLVTGLARRDRELLEPQLRELTTLKDFEALEAVLEEQARGSTERPAWLLDAYDRLGLVDKYVTRLRTATKWRERAFAAELLGRVGNAKAVPALLDTVAATRTEDADVREIALRALARIGDPRALTPLVNALKQSEVWLVPRIADILTRHGDLAVDPMIAFLEDPARHPARAWAASILGEVGAARAFPSLVRALTDLDDEVRAKSASALGRIGDGRAVGYLLDHLLSDPAPFVRARIAQALGQFDQPEVVERLVRALGDPAWWVRMRSVEALEQVGAQAEGPLLLALDDADPEIRIRAAVALERLGVPARLIAAIERGENTVEATETLARFGNAGARELLAEGLGHLAAPVRGAMIEAIRRAGRRDLAAELVQLSRTDTEPALRATAFDVLRALGVTEGIAAALDHLNDPDQRVRTAAMLLVGQLGGPELADQIRPRTADPDPAVRAATATALGLTQARGAADDFIRLLKDPDAGVRAAAARGAADANAREAGPTLLGLLTDTDLDVQREAVLALGRLGDPSVAGTLLKHLAGGPTGDSRRPRDVGHPARPGAGPGAARSAHRGGRPGEQARRRPDGGPTPHAGRAVDPRRPLARPRRRGARRDRRGARPPRWPRLGAAAHGRTRRSRRRGARPGRGRPRAARRRRRGPGRPRPPPAGSLRAGPRARRPRHRDSSEPRAAKRACSRQACKRRRRSRCAPRRCSRWAATNRRAWSAG